MSANVGLRQTQTDDKMLPLPQAGHPHLALRLVAQPGEADLRPRTEGDPGEAEAGAGRPPHCRRLSPDPLVVLGAGLGGAGHDEAGLLQGRGPHLETSELRL